MALRGRRINDFDKFNKIINLLPHKAIYFHSFFYETPYTVVSYNSEQIVDKIAISNMNQSSR